MATPEQIYKNWRDTLRNPDDSIFYYHPDLERILLGMAIFEIGSRPMFRNLGKAESLRLIPIYINDLITAWIDEDNDRFEKMWELLMPLMEMYPRLLFAAEREYPKQKKTLHKIANFCGGALACGGDMSPELAEILLDDLSTDGKTLDSSEIEKFATRLNDLLRFHGPEPSSHQLNRLNGW